MSICSNRRPRRFRLGVEACEPRLLLCVSPGEHIHAELTIRIHGQNIVIPAGIGVFQAGDANPHTVDASGELHIGDGGPPGLGSEDRLMELRDFFDIWRERGGAAGNNADAFFSDTQILQHQADAVRRVRMFVNGNPNTQFERFTPCDGDRVLIEYFVDPTRNPWHNPSQTTDVNRIDGTTPLDALLVINELTNRQFSNAATGELPVTGGVSAIDVNNDLVVAPLDALLVINALPGSTQRSALSSSLDASREAIDGRLERLPVNAGLGSTASEDHASRVDWVLASPYFHPSGVDWAFDRDRDGNLA